MQRACSIIRPLYAVACGILATVLVATVVVGARSAETTQAADTNVEDETLEIFRLADRSNLRRLDNGDFLFRLARDLRTGIVYWAYMGSTRHVVAFTPDRSALADDEVARAALLRIADLPRRVGCGVGLIHRSWVYIVPEGVMFGAAGATPDIAPVFVKGEVQNDVSGRTPVSLLSFHNFVSSD